jgi:hypothetical protein
VTAGPSGGLAIEAPGDEVALGGVEVLHGIGMELAAGAAGNSSDAPANQAPATPISGIHAWLDGWDHGMESQQQTKSSERTASDASQANIWCWRGPATIDDVAENRPGRSESFQLDHLCRLRKSAR